MTGAAITGALYGAGVALAIAAYHAGRVVYTVTKSRRWHQLKYL